MLTLPAHSKILVAMSGGVDSSVAAALLTRAGHEVVGVFMRLGSPGESLDQLEADDAACDTRHAKPLKIAHQGCCSIGDAADARLVAAELGIPFYVCNFKKDFNRIIDYFADEYVAGRTPNPCVRCNDWLKFGKLHEYATQIGASYVASGHYARIESGPHGPRLMRGHDASKDQSYVLFGMPRTQLAHTLFPVGHLPKSEVRALARQLGLPVFDKPDSQEICFVPDNDYAALVEKRRPDAVPSSSSTGEFVNASGAVIGTHAGQHRFTIGQRRGLSLSLGHPVYVVAKDATTNRVRVGTKDELMATGCTAHEANWLSETPALNEWRTCIAKYRYNTPGAPARFRRSPDIDEATPSGRVGAFEVEFDAPQAAIAPGQAVVLYGADEPDVVIGGGWIRGVMRSDA